MSRKNCHLLLLPLVAALLLGCGHHRYDGELALVDSLQKLDSTYLSDSLLQPIVRYYDHHGSRNQQARAHYLLGRTYHIEGLLPQALDAYQTAAERADTTARDRDYSLLMKVYSQMHEVFQRQFMHKEAIASIHLMERYAWLSKDTFTAISSSYYKIAPFYACGQFDSVLYYGEKAIRELKQSGYPQYADFVYGSLIPVYMKQDDVQNVNRMMELYEASSAFDTLGNVLPGGETFYYNKGLSYMGRGDLDSAEFYFRKELRTGKDHNNQIAGSHGLSLVFERLHQPDSAYKYSKLSYEISDSAYNLSLAENLQQIQAAYDYSRHLRAAEQKQRETETYRRLLLFSLIFISLGTVFILLYLNAQRKKHDEEKLLIVSNYQQNLLRMQLKQSELNCLLSDRDHDNQSLIKQLENNIRELEEMLEIQENRLSLFSRDKSDTNRRLLTQDICQKFRDMATYHKEEPNEKDWTELVNAVDIVIPGFFTTINQKTKLDIKSVRLCVLIRLFFPPKEMALLLNCSQSNVSLMRRRLLKKIFNIDGKPEMFDKMIQDIM